MEKRRTELRGMSTTDNYTEGDAMILYNLRPLSGGGYVPCEIAEVEEGGLKVRDGYRLHSVFLHQTSEYRHLLVVQEREKGLAVDWYETDDECHAKGNPRELLALSDTSALGAFTGVEQTGNVLSFVFAKDIYYALWRDGAYHALGTFPDLPELQMRAGKTNEEVKLANPETATKKELEDAGAVLIGGKDELNSTKDEVLWTRIREAWEGLIGKLRQEKQAKDGVACLFDPISIRYAFRLFDGRIMRPSAPILIMPQDFIRDFYSPLMHPVLTWLADEGGVYLAPPALRSYSVEVALPDLSALEPWLDIITSIDFFASEPIDMRSGAVALRGAINMSGWSFGKRARHVTYYDRSESVVRNDISDRTKVEERTDERITNASQFYLIHSIDLRRDVKAGKYYRATDGLMVIPSRATTVYRDTDIRYQELMPSGALSHHRYGAKGVRSMNGRLRLSDVHTTLFPGFARLFLWDRDDRPYNGSVPKEKFEPGSTLLVDVELAVEGRTVHVQQSAPIVRESFHMPALFAYPDTRARHFTLYVHEPSKGWTEVLSQALRPHPDLAVAYYIETEPIATIGVQTGDPDPGSGTTTPGTTTTRNNGTGGGRR